MKLLTSSSSIFTFFTILILLSLSLSPAMANELQEEIVENQECERQYQNLITNYGKDYSDCYGEVKTSECAKKMAEEKNKITNLVLVMDASGSMSAQISGGNKMEVAKKSARKFIKSLDPKTNVGLIVYGHKGSNQRADRNVSCAGAEVVQDIAPINAGALQSKIDTLRATGWTPIGASLLKAREMLARYPSDKYRNIIVLISDGEETCGGNPVQIAQEISQSNIKVITNAIGFGVGGSAEKQLKAIAANGKGKYYAAHSANELNLALGKMANQQICTVRNIMDEMESGLSVNTSYINCGLRINTELQRVQIGINMVGFNKDKDEKTGITVECKDYVMDKYDERADSIRAQIEQAYKEGRDAMDKAFNKER